MKLIERFINLKDDMSEKEQYFDDVVKIMQYSYKNVSGGCPSDMEKYLKPEYFWKLVKRDGKIVAAIIYKLTGQNRKYLLIGSDGSDKGKAAVKQMLSDDIRLVDRGAYGEVSGAVEHIATKYGCKKIPNTVARQILSDLGKGNIAFCDGNGNVNRDDGYHYKRMIQGIEKVKLMIGNIPDEFKNYMAPDYEVTETDPDFLN
jgi:prepilin-type processing-associated H-X9-DG protein